MKQALAKLGKHAGLAGPQIRLAGLLVMPDGKCPNKASSTGWWTTPVPVVLSLGVGCGTCFPANPRAGNASYRVPDGLSVCANCRF